MWIGDGTRNRARSWWRRSVQGGEEGRTWTGEITTTCWEGATGWQGSGRHGEGRHTTWAYAYETMTSEARSGSITRLSSPRPWSHVGADAPSPPRRATPSRTSLWRTSCRRVVPRSYPRQVCRRATCDQEAGAPRCSRSSRQTPHSIR